MSVKDIDKTKKQLKKAKNKDKGIAKVDYIKDKKHKKDKMSPDENKKMAKKRKRTSNSSGESDLSMGATKKLKSKTTKEDRPSTGKYQLTTADSLRLRVDDSIATSDDVKTTTANKRGPKKRVKTVIAREDDSGSESSSISLPDGVFIPERIVAHTGDAKNFKSRMRFKVHWKGIHVMINDIEEISFFFVLLLNMIAIMEG